MIQFAGDVDLTSEARFTKGGGKLRAHDLESDDSIHPEIESSKDIRRAASTDMRFDCVSLFEPVEQALEPCRAVGLPSQPQQISARNRHQTRDSMGESTFFM